MRLPCLESISELGRANEYLARTFLPGFNRRFRVAAASDADVHGSLPRQWEEVLSWEETRVVQRDWTVACAGSWYQLDRQHEALSLAGRKIVVRTLRSGMVQLLAVNFSRTPASQTLEMPNIRQTTAIDLMTGLAEKKPLESATFRLNLPPWTGKVILFQTKYYN